MVGASHCASVAPVWQTHGWTCGPEKIGPPIGWLTIVAVAAVPSGRLACTVFEPVEETAQQPLELTVGP